MNHSSIHGEIPRRLAVLILSEERGRSPNYPLDPSSISKWCADLGFRKGLKYFNQTEFQQLSAINKHYAGGGSRQDLLKRLREIQYERNN